jgi:transposase
VRSSVNIWKVLPIRDPFRWDWWGRAKMILLSASGKTNVQIARQSGVSNATVGKWRRRFLKYDVAGLHDELRPGPPSPD